jgi:hypothetical protein
VPAALDANLRSGLFKEQLGILILQSFTAVAQVPIHSDVGIDAVATLLRRVGSRRLLAEDSFYVQLKSDSKRAIEYSGDELKWLMSLQLPFLIGSVSSSGLKLYATHRLSMLAAEGVESATICMDLDEVPEVISPEVRSIYLGPPILEFPFEQTSIEEFRDNAYSVVKSHISVDRRNLIHRLAGRFELVKWQTGHPVQENGFGMITKPFDRERLPRIVGAVSPLLEVLLFYLQTKGDTGATNAVRELLARLSPHGPVPSSIVLGFSQMLDFQGQPVEATPDSQRL